LFYILNRNKYFLKFDDGVNQTHLLNKVFSRCRISVPNSVKEQKAIAEALSDVDALIDSLEALLIKKRNIKTGVMQELLTGHTRLPGFSGEWQTLKIGSFTICTAGGTPSTVVAEYWGGPIRWMSSGELNLKRVHEVDGRITETGLHNSSTTMVPAKCVLIGLAGQGKTRGTTAINFIELCTNQSIAAIFPSKSHVSEFLYYLLDTKYEELRGLSDGGGGRGGLNLSIINAIEVTLPSVSEQKAIAEVLSDIDAEIEALEKRLTKTRDLKQGMAQELLTGRTRLL
jgi:type I restriction enzyme S subunit